MGMGAGEEDRVRRKRQRVCDGGFDASDKFFFYRQQIIADQERRGRAVFQIDGGRDQIIVDTGGGVKSIAGNQTVGVGRGDYDFGKTNVHRGALPNLGRSCRHTTTARKQVYDDDTKIILSNY